MSSPFFSVLVGIAPFVPFFVILLFCAMRRPKTCPDCGELLPRIQSPFKMTRRQWMEGGYVCPQCGCQVDTAGRKVPANAPLRVGRFVTVIVALTLVSVIGAILLSLILRKEAPFAGRLPKSELNQGQVVFPERPSSDLK